MRKHIFTAILVLLAAAVIGLLIFEIVTEKKLEASSLLRTVLVLISCVTALVKIHAPFSNSQSKQIYEEAYRDILRYAFDGDKEKANRSRLLTAIGYFNKNQTDKAIRILKKLVSECKTKEDYSAVLTFLACCYDSKHDTESAKKAYQDLLDKDPKNGRAWSNLGLLYASSDAEQAEACYRKGMELDERNPYPYQNLSTLCFRSGRYEEAIQYAETALRRKPDFYQAANTLCLSHKILGDNGKSQKYYQIAIANGGSAEKLTQALEQIRKGNFAPPAQPQISDSVYKALKELYTDTSKLYAGMQITDKPTKSRLGGDSIGYPPLDSTGKPMRMLCAIYFSEVPPLPDFPEKGLLRIYLEESEDYGCDFDDFSASEKRYRVLFTESEEEITETYSYPPLDSDTYYESFPICGSASIRFLHATASITDTDYRFKNEVEKYLAKYGAKPYSELSKDEMHFVWENFCTSASGIGGQPYFWMSDPREDDEVSDYDVLLFQLISGSAEGAEIMIGEGGIMNFFIRRDDLKRHDFSDILYNWDCD